jgi:hypothetical protein
MGNREWVIGNGEWGMGNREWVIGNGEWVMGNREWVIGNGKSGMGNGNKNNYQLPITNYQLAMPNALCPHALLPSL